VPRSYLPNPALIQVDSPSPKELGLVVLYSYATTAICTRRLDACLTDRAHYQIAACLPNAPVTAKRLRGSVTDACPVLSRTDLLSQRRPYSWGSEGSVPCRLIGGPHEWRNERSHVLGETNRTCAAREYAAAVVARREDPAYLQPTCGLASLLAWTGMVPCSSATQGREGHITHVACGL